MAKKQGSRAAFAARIAELRARHGLSYETIGARAGQSANTVRNWELGAHAPRKWEDVERLERALGAQSGELWELLTGVKRDTTEGDGSVARAADPEQQQMYAMVLQLGADVHQQAMQAIVLERRMQELADSVSEARRATDQRLEELRASMLEQIEARTASASTPRSPRRQ